MNDLRYNVKTDNNNRIRIKNEINGKSTYFQNAIGAENFGYLVSAKHNELKNNEANLLRRISSECNIVSTDDDKDEHWEKSSGDGFGFSVRGDAPVIITSVEPRSLADVSFHLSF